MSELQHVDEAARNDDIPTTVQGWETEPAADPGDKPEIEQVEIKDVSYMKILGRVAELAETLGNCKLTLSLVERIKAKRNAPCPCGSKKKYKFCCISKNMTRTRAIPRGSYMPEPEFKTESSRLGHVQMAADERGKET